MRLKRSVSNLLLFLLVVCICMPLFRDHAAAVAPGTYSQYCGATVLGRQGCHGYFGNLNYFNDDPDSTAAVSGTDILINWSDTKADAIPINIATAASFENEIVQYLQQASSGTYDYDGVGAAFIIDSMLGENGTSLCSSGTCTWQDGVKYANANLANWEARVNYYAQKGWISWDQQVTLPIGTYDSTHLCYVGAPTSCGGSAEIRQYDSQDFTYRADNSTAITDMIVFHNPDGSVVEIRRACGNLTAPTEGLTAPPGSTNPTPTPTPTPPPPPPPVYTCGNSSTDPATLQPNQSFTTNINVDYSGGTPIYTSFHVSITGSSSLYANNNAQPVSKTASSLSYSVPSLRAPPEAGAYTISWQLYNGNIALSPSCSGQIKTIALPYFSVYGSDVSSGGDFNACTANGGTLAGWYDSQNAQAGASTLLGAIAIGKINGFASAQNTATGAPNNPANGLSFANTSPVSGSSPSAKLGGNFGGVHCLFSPTAPKTTEQNIVSPTTIGLGALTSGAHSYNGNLYLNGGTVASGKSIAIYVTGNVYIKSNITYGTDTNGTWTINKNGGTDIPSFTLVDTGGNIYLDPSVSELDGIYVAESSNDHGGTIYTCSQISGSSFVPVAAPNLYTSCAGQLTVYGSFIADQVNLMRTYGTLNDAKTSDNPAGAKHVCSNGVNASVCAAEVFDFSPEMYLSSPDIQQPNNGAETYNAMTSLPPVL
jgi:hypothetical protein